MLTGTLEDVGVVELIQFPNAARKTGELRISSATCDAQLYYEEGDLVHVELGRDEGMDALARVIDFAEGRFAFQVNVVSPKRSLKTDLHRSIMIALKTRDEARLGGQHVQSPCEDRLHPMQVTLDSILKDHAAIDYACVMDESGGLVGHAKSGSEPPAGVDELRAIFAFLAAAHPRPALSRVCVDDALGTMAFVKSGDLYLLVVAGQNAPPDAVDEAASQLLARLCES